MSVYNDAFMNQNTNILDLNLKNTEGSHANKYPRDLGLVMKSGNTEGFRWDIGFNTGIWQDEKI